ncbi:MAG: DUF362 domain-containing protein [Candidatus Aminicenantes bacterium]|nr:DUF362 domain-containing protein [Candidatus Aminicenantes bacterium]
MNRKPFTRRDFLRAAALAPLAGAFAAHRPSGGSTRASSAPAATARVVLIRDKDMLGPDRRIVPSVVEKMLDDAVSVFFGTKTPQEAWNGMIRPDDIVGIKSNVWSPLPTGPEIEGHLKKRVMDCGVPESHVGVADRGLLKNPLFTGATALINVRPARTHHWAGVGSCIKNMITFVPQPYLWHGDSCADLAKLWELPHVKGKVRLNILVMLTPLFHGIGPHHYSSRYVWDYRGLLVGTDPVAVDSVGVRILEAKRREFFGGDRPLQPPAHHIRYADTRHGLGVSDPARIELVRLGWREGALI